MFLEETHNHSKAWMETGQNLSNAISLDKKTEELAYLAVMAAVGLLSGIPFHVNTAKQHGATRDEIKSSILLPLPAVGNSVIKALPIALDAFDASK